MNSLAARPFEQVQAEYCAGICRPFSAARQSANLFLAGICPPISHVSANLDQTPSLGGRRNAFVFLPSARFWTGTLLGISGRFATYWNQLACGRVGPVIDVKKGTGSCFTDRTAEGQ